MGMEEKVTKKKTEEVKGGSGVRDGATALVQNAFK